MYQTFAIAALTLLLQSGQELYQQALVQERAAGNLQAAISLYEDAARNTAGDRVLAVRALMGAARCYEKLGQLKAREIYQDIARSYPDQRQSLEAQGRLDALTPNRRLIFSVPVPPGSVPALPAEGVVRVADGIFWQQTTPQFDPSKPITVTGNVVAIRLVNPSSSIQIAVRATDGSTIMYRIYGANPRRLIEQGFRRELLHPGDIVTVEGFLGSEPGTIGHATLTLPDGSKFPLGMSVSGALESPR